MPEQEKEKFSFESAPNKIGSDKDGGAQSDFSFDDVPILGKKEKPSSILDLLGRSDSDKPAIKKPKATVADAKVPSDQNSVSSSPDSGGVLSTGTDEWLIATAPKKKSKKQLILIISLAGSVLVAISIIGIGIYLKSMKENAEEESLKPTQRRPRTKEEIERAKQEEERKQFEQTVSGIETLLQDNKLENAEEQIKNLLTKYPERSILYTLMARLELKRNKIELATENYIKAVSTGTEIPEPFVQLCNFNILSKKFPEAKEFSEKGLKKFPEDQDILRAHAKICLALGDTQTAIETFDKVDKKNMTQNELSDYAKALLNTGQTRKAKDLWTYIGKKFNDYEAFENALSLETDPLEKMSISNMALTQFENEPDKKNKILMLLVKDLIKSGRKDLALEKLKTVDLEQLSPENVIFYAETTFSSTSDILLKDKVETIVNSNKNNYSLLKKILDMLLQMGRNNIAVEVFSEHYAKHPNSEAFIYFYARCLDPHENAIKYYQEAINKKNNFPDAWKDLGKCLIMHRRYSDAEQALLQAKKLSPDDSSIEEDIFLSRFYFSRSQKVIEDYKNTLLKQNHPNPSLAIIKYAQMLDNPSYSESIIKELENINPKTALFWRVRHDIIYWNNPERHFTDYYPPELRPLHIAFLLSQGRLKQVMLLPIPPEQFPEFWKIFIMWRGNIEGWEEIAIQFHEKHKTNSSLSMLAYMLFSKEDPENLRRQIYRVSQEHEPIFFLILAEQFRKAGSSIKAKVCYARAMGDGPGLYKKAIQFFENN